jgi:hypothetical protein
MKKMIFIQIIIVLLSTSLISLGNYFQEPVIYIAESEKKILDPKLLIVEEIAKTFPENKEVMLAIAIEESNLNPNATGYNCRYKIGGKTFDKLTGTYIDVDQFSKEKKAGYISTWCRDKSQAWSKDGGIFQVHNPKAEHYIPKVNIKEARNKYDTQGLGAWTAYTTGRYKDNLLEARNLLTQI